MENLIPLIVPALVYLAVGMWEVIKCLGRVLWGTIVFLYLVVEAFIDTIIEVACSIPPSGWISILWLVLIAVSIMVCYYGMTTL